MDNQLKREFVSVQFGVDCTGFTKTINTIKDVPGCRVTQHKDTITIVCSTLRGLASLAMLSTSDQGESGASRMFRAINDELVKFMG